MQHAIIRYVGSYTFEGRDALDRALATARSQIAEDDELAALEGGWLRCFVMHGSTLTINLAIPAVADLRFAAAEVFEALSRTATGGTVEGKIGDAYVDYYPSGDDD
ncbi:MAG: hypothetical protein H0T79_09620 [Deltaproteobacteria bacterium]|nr:hypothetical protein [Deltaproteobacteria bacterium]